MHNELLLGQGFIQTCMEDVELSDWLLNFFEENELNRLKAIMSSWRNGWGDHIKDWRDGWGNHEKS